MEATHPAPPAPKPDWRKTVLDGLLAALALTVVGAMYALSAQIADLRKDVAVVQATGGRDAEDIRAIKTDVKAIGADVAQIKVDLAVLRADTKAVLERLPAPRH